MEIVKPSRSFRGGYDASTNLYPIMGGSGINGKIVHGDNWIITADGNLGNELVVYTGERIYAFNYSIEETTITWVKEGVQYADDIKHQAIVKGDCCIITTNVNQPDIKWHDEIIEVEND